MAVFDKASLVMIPSQYKEGKIYNIKPEDQSSSFEFERGSAATRVNSSGLIETFYDEATNLLLQSNQFDTTWSSNGITETSGQAGYDGSNDAWLIEKSNPGVRVEQSISGSGVTTFSVYVKAGTLNFAILNLSSFVQYFDLENGVLGNESGFIPAKIDSGIESVGNGWYRCYITTNQSYTIARIYPARANGDNSGSSGNIIIQDAQLESGYFATPYIETTTEAVTRPNRHDTPRLDYSGTEPSLLLEPQRTNLIANANSYSGNLVYYTVTSGQTSPDGGNNATLFVEKTNTASHIINSNGASISGGQTYTYSFFIKYAGKQNIPVNASDGLSGFGANIDILNGVVNSGTAEIQEFEDGWYRVSMTRTAGAGATNATIQMNFGNITGDGQSGFYLFGYQIEAGSYATSYIPTNGQAETRLADVCNNAGDGTIFNDEEGVLYFEAKTDNENVGSISINDGTLSNRLTARFRPDISKVQLTVIGTTDDFNYNSATITLTEYNKIAIVYNNSQYYFFVNGEKSTIQNRGTFDSNDLTQLDFNRGGGGERFYGDIKVLAYFNRALTDTELQQLTTI